MYFTQDFLKDDFCFQINFTQRAQFQLRTLFLRSPKLRVAENEISFAFRFRPNSRAHPLKFALYQVACGALRCTVKIMSLGKVSRHVGFGCSFYTTCLPCCHSLSLSAITLSGTEGPTVIGPSPCQNPPTIFTPYKDFKLSLSRSRSRKCL